MQFQFENPNDEGEAPSAPPRKVVAIGLMAYTGAVPVETKRALREFEFLAWKKGWETICLDSVGNCRLHDARNALVAHFRHSEATDLLFIDADTYSTAEALVRICEVPLDFVGIAVTGRDQEVNWNVRWLPGRPFLVPFDPVTGELTFDGMIEVDAVGTGIVRISRKVFDEIERADPENWYTEPNAPHRKAQRFFDFPMIDHLSWGEDLTFCKRWRALGGPIYVYPRATSWHIARVQHQANLHEWLTTIPESVAEKGLESLGEDVRKAVRSRIEVKGEALPSVAMLVPSRGRAGALKQNLERIIATMERPSTRIVVAFDEDEAELYEGVDRHAQIVLSCAPREDTMSAKYERCFRAVKADHYVVWADDIVMKTPGWDRVLAEAAVREFPDGIGAVYFGTPIVPTAISPGLSYTSKLVEKVGRFVEPGYPYSWFCVDTANHEIAAMIGRIARIGSEVEIGAVSLGKTQGLRDSFFWRKYFDALRPEREMIARRVISDPEFVATPEEKRDLILGIPAMRERFFAEGFPLRHAANAARIEEALAESAPVDERYLRAKRAAEIRLDELVEVL